jgi:hypothetical protein
VNHLFNKFRECRKYSVTPLSVDAAKKAIFSLTHSGTGGGHRTSFEASWLTKKAKKLS